MNISLVTTNGTRLLIIVQQIVNGMMTISYTTVEPFQRKSVNNNKLPLST